MSLSPEFIAKARALAFYRKNKVRRAKALQRRTNGSRAKASRWLEYDEDGLAGWTRLGRGHFGEAWEHEDHLGLVVKISGRAGFGAWHGRSDSKPSLDGWPTFAQHCLTHPHPNLPKILHFERLTVGVSFGIMPHYKSINAYNVDADGEIVREWRDYLEGAKGAPEWMWPIIGMRGALGMRVDLHSDNVMRDADTGEYIMTDPFSFVS